MSRTTTIAPKFAPLRLPELEQGSAADFVVDGSIDGVRFDGLDLSGERLGGLNVRECELLGLNLNEADLRGASFAETRIERLNAPVLRASRSSWHDVIVEQSRIGSAELYDGGWRGVQFVGCKLGYLNLRGSKLRDVSFIDCQIDELDLGGATVVRMSLPGSNVRTLSVEQSSFQHVDLRGAELAVVNGIDGLAGTTLTSWQLTQLAPAFADRLGITLAD